MKKQLFTFLLMLLIGGSTALGQSKKGSWFVDGLNILTFQVGTLKQTNDILNTKTNISDFYIGPSFLNGNPRLDLGPSVNYCFTDNLSGGIFLNLNLNSQNDKSSNAGKTNSSSFVIGPALRYSFPVIMKCQSFVEGKFGFGSRSTRDGFSNESEANISAWYLGVGNTYYIKSKLGINFTLGYRNLISKDEDSQFGTKNTYSLFDIGVGVLIGF